MGSSIGAGTDPDAAGAGTMGDSGLMEPITFPTPEAFRAWLEQHHDSERELWVGYHRKATGRPSMTWPESVDEALCFGWIDGLRKSLDGERYMIRFTPRRHGSVWSAVNIRRVAALKDEGRMRPAGLKAFEARRDDRWVMTGKKPETREQRLGTLIEASAAGRTVPPLTPRRRAG
jgi:uncharacterized protein YdeI (YjbR/CyaY-like superfamily)